MSSMLRDSSCDREPVLKRQHSFSESSRVSIPMWDSSDPERAPPPLPLNPTTGNNLSPTKPNISATVAAVAQALADRARENVGPSPYVVNQFPDRSPEKSPSRAAQHKRLQSLQTASTKELRASFENNHPSTSNSSRETNGHSPERINRRSGSQTPVARGRDLVKDVSNTRASSVASVQSDTGESASPHTSCVAYATIEKSKLKPMSDIISSTPTITSFNVQNIHVQIQNLTAIATTLQKEMVALSRRSKDNATDLDALKEATNKRDQDIRESLKELVSTTKATEASILSSSRLGESRSSSALGIHSPFLDSRAFASPSISKSVSLPRIPSVNFDMPNEFNRSNVQTSNVFDGSVASAQLEQILQQMGTKEGQHRVIQSLTDLLNHSTVHSGHVTRQLDSIIDLVKDKTISQALIKHRQVMPAYPNTSDNIELGLVKAGRESIGSQTSRQGTSTQSTSYATEPISNVVNEDFLRLLQRIKDSVQQTGGLTGEVKSLVRELRGEVLGMGRELGRKLEVVKATNEDGHDVDVSEGQENLQRIVQEGLSELKEQMDQVIESRRRQSLSSHADRTAIDATELYSVVKHALIEQGYDGVSKDSKDSPPLDQTAILTAVKEAYEAYKPEIELQQFGLERDEILQCLKEGLEDYQSLKAEKESPAIDKEMVLLTVQDAMRDFVSPVPRLDSNELKQEVLAAVQECLKSFQPTIARGLEQQVIGVSRDEVLDAVREELGVFKKDGVREFEISGDDLYFAMKAALENMEKPLGQYGDQVLTSLHDILARMHTEFQEYSAANGRDTEQVLDALKDGLESLRAEVESYVDRAQDVTGKDEIIDTLKDGLASLRSNIETCVEQSQSNDNITKLSDHINSGFANLNQVLATQSQAGGSENLRDDLLTAFAVSLADVKSSITNCNTDDTPEQILEAVKDEFEQLRDAILSGSTAGKNEILNVLQDSLSNLHNEIQVRSPDSHEDLLATLRQEFAALRSSGPAALVRFGCHTADSDVLETVKETLDNIRVQLTRDTREVVQESIGTITSELEHLRDSVSTSIIVGNIGVDKSCILDAIHEGLQGIRQSQDNREAAQLDNAGMFTHVKIELEHLRQSIATGLSRSGTQPDADEVLDAVRLNVDDLRMHLDKSLDNPERFASTKMDILEAFTDGVDILRTDLLKMQEKPIDMTMIHELLNSLKEGIVSIHADLRGLKENNSLVSKDSAVVLADSETHDRCAESADEKLDLSNLQKKDLDKVEVMIAQLQIKVEALDQNMSSSVQTTNTSSEWKESLDSVERALAEILASVSGLVDLKQDVSTLAKKDDVEAMETLIYNTKAKIEDQVIPALGALVTRCDFEEAGRVAQETNASVSVLLARSEIDVATKVDVAALDILMQEASASLKDISERLPSTNLSESITKEDLVAIENVCRDIKEKTITGTTSETLPSKDDIEHLTYLVRVFRESHDALKDRYETDVSITVKAFDDRKKETDGLRDDIRDLRDVVEEARDELKSKIKRGNADVRGLDEILESVEEKIEALPRGPSEIPELLRTVKEEFENAHIQVERAILKGEEQAKSLGEKHDETRYGIVSDLRDRFDERLDEILFRHDALLDCTSKASATINERAIQQDELLAESKTIAEELKLSIDTLGSTVTSITPALTETTEKLSSDARTVFSKIETIQASVDNGVSERRDQHQSLHKELLSSQLVLEKLSEESTKFYPEASDTLARLVSTVGDHFEHFKKAQEASTQHAVRSSDELRDIKNAFATLPVSSIAAPPLSSIDLSQSLNETTLATKLDELLRRTSSSTEENGAGLAKMEEMHLQVMAAASEMSAFVAMQSKVSQMQASKKEDKARLAEIQLARLGAEKDKLEGSIKELRGLKDELISSVASLQSEREDLTMQRHRLATETSSIRTALELRREELQLMDTRADALERRIIDGVMNHSRSLLLAKTPQVGAASKNLKRVVSNISATPGSASLGGVKPHVANSSIEKALHSRSRMRKAVKINDPTARRILSLSEIAQNGPNTLGAISMPRQVPAGTDNLKRSQSVRNPALRNTSWNGHENLAGHDNKENESMDEHGETGGTQVSNGHSASYAESQTTDRDTVYSVEHGGFSYDESSYFTGTESERRSSYGSTIRSANNGAGSLLESSIDEDNEEQASEGEDGVARGFLAAHGLQLCTVKADDMVGYDSGLGSDLPTVDLSTAVGSSCSGSTG